jgi:hypothetical protein
MKSSIDLSSSRPWIPRTPKIALPSELRFLLRTCSQTAKLAGSKLERMTKRSRPSNRLNSQSSRRTLRSVRQIWAAPIAVAVAEMTTTTQTKRGVVIKMTSVGTPNLSNAPVAANKTNKFTSPRPAPKT